MSKYTVQLRTITESESYEIFDFEYTRSATAQAIVSDDDLEEGFISHFYFREVGFETLERFKKKLATKWLESIGNFDKLLIAYNDTINIKSNIKNTSTNNVQFKDIPENSLGEGAYPSNITDSSGENEGYLNITEIEMLELYHNKLRDIQTEFYNSFESLFMQIF